MKDDKVCGWCRTAPGAGWLLGWPGDSLVTSNGEAVAYWNLLLCRTCMLLPCGWTFDREAERWRPRIPDSIRAC